MNFVEAIKKRRSVRTFDKKEKIDKDIIENIKVFLNNQSNPYNIKIEWFLFNKEENNLYSNVISGEEYYIVGKLKRIEYAEEAFGYEFEEIILYLTSLGLGTTWIAGTLPRDLFNKLVDLKDDEIMPAVTPLGIINKKMSFKEKLMRKAISADSRIDFDKLYFSKSFDNPLNDKELEKYKDILELVRKSPSAVNKQPARIIIDDNKFYFYKKPTKGYKRDEFDVQKVDLGIALNHFIQGLKYKNINYEFNFNNPNIDTDCEYIITVIIK